MSTSPAYAMRSPQQGVALVITLIMAMLTLVVIVTVVSIAASRSYGGSGASKQSDQAMLAAQSGIDSFMPRIKAGSYSGTIYGIECWVEGYSSTTGDNGLSTTTTCPTTATRNLPTQYLTTDQVKGPRAVVDIVGSLDEVNSAFTVRSTGYVGPTDSAAKAVITQKIKMIKPTALNVTPPAALTSCSSIKGGGSATINGGTQAQTGIVPLYESTSNINNPTQVKTTGAKIDSSTTWPQTITISDSTIVLGRGSYISINNVAYRVDQRKSDTQLVISPADSAHAPTSGSLSGGLSAIPFALRNTVTATGNTAVVARSTQGSNVTLPTYRLPFSDPSGVYPGDVLYVPIPDSTGAVKTYAVTVTAKGYVDNDPEQGYIEVALSVTNEATNLYGVGKSGTTTIVTSGAFQPPTAAQLLSMKPGTDFSRYIAGGTSASDINGNVGTSDNSIILNWGSSTTVLPAAMAGNTALDCSTSDSLFKQVFNGLAPSAYYDYANQMGGVTFPGTTPPTMSGGLYWLGDKVYPSTTSYSFSSAALCGSGVLVVNGDLDMQGTCAQGFTGVLFVMGDLKNAGNGNITGAVVVQGRSKTSQASFTGTLGINYDQGAVMRAAKDLSKPIFSVLPGGWSQQ